MMHEALKKMYQLLLTEPHAPTVCAQLERIAREALAEHAMRETQRLGQEIEQKPAAWITPDGEGFRIRFSPPTSEVPLKWDALYTTPPQRKPLTDEQIFACENSVPDEIVSDRDWCIHFARAIEAKIKENT
jgi:hypothetical protein